MAPISGIPGIEPSCNSRRRRGTRAFIAVYAAGVESSAAGIRVFGFGGRIFAVVRERRGASEAKHSIGLVHAARAAASLRVFVRRGIHAVFESSDERKERSVRRAAALGEVESKPLRRAASRAPFALHRPHRARFARAELATVSDDRRSRDGIVLLSMSRLRRTATHLSPLRPRRAHAAFSAGSRGVRAV